MSIRMLGAAAALLVVLACERQQPTPGTVSAYADSARVETGAYEDGTAHTATGVELQAKPLIPATRDLLRRLQEQPAERARANLNNHKHQLADLVSAMQADLNRAGSDRVSAIRELGDSAMEDLGGGTGNADQLQQDLTREDLDRHVDRVNRLIELYDSEVRTAQR